MHSGPSLWIFVLATCYSGLKGAMATTTHTTSSHPPPTAPSFSVSNVPSFLPSTTPSFSTSITPSPPPSAAPSIPPHPSFTTTPSLPPSTAPSLPPSTTPSFPPSITPSLPPSTTPSFPTSITPSLPPSTAHSLPPYLSPTTTPSFPSSIAPTLTVSTASSSPPSTKPLSSPSSTTFDTSPPPVSLTSSSEVTQHSTLTSETPTSTPIEGESPWKIEVQVLSGEEVHTPCDVSYDVEVKCVRHLRCCGSCDRGTNNTCEPVIYNVTEETSCISGLSNAINVTTKNAETSCELNITASTDFLKLEWREFCSPCTNGTERSELREECNGNVTGLDPFTEYNVAVFYDGGGKNCMESFITLPAAPTRPMNLHVTQPAFSDHTNRSREAVITWNPPVRRNGMLKQYTLKYHSSNSKPHTEDIPAEYCHEECTVSRVLKPETNYKFSVTAENEEPAGEKSEPETFNFTTKTGRPFFTVYEPLKYDEDKVTYYSIILLLDGSSISNDNGKITLCEVWMQHGCNVNINNRFKERVYCSSSPQHATFPIVIGEGRPTESDCQARNLEPGTCYTFHAIIHTKTSWTISNSIQVNTKEDPVKIVLYVLLVILTIVLLGIIGAIIIYRQRYQPIFRRSESIELPLVVPSPPDISVERRILLSDLTATVENLFSNGSIGLFTEYADLRSLSTLKSCNYANLPVNREKSRYANILPFDETRVVLKENTSIYGSDFINASYIHGYSVAREFIACQGPMSNTVHDFWRMVWEKNVHVIVMVTQCIEKNKEKCFKYWPDVNESFTFGESMLKVRTLEEKEQSKDGYIHRTLQLSKRCKLRSVQQFHFVTWPDMGCPATPDQLINFVKTVKEAVPTESSHVVVHCSAGVGRTGTFIGLSNLMEEMCDQNSTDVFHAVYRMRLHRTNMVQTEVQYSFLYKCVLKYYLDQREQSKSWSAIERRLEKNTEVRRDAINGALREPQHANIATVDTTYSTISEEEGL